MRGRYHMMDWEEMKWKLILTQTIAQLSQDKSYQADFTNEDVCPANLCHVMELLGWDEDTMEDNGWQNDTWHYFYHRDYDFGVIVYYEGYTFELKVYRTDCE